MFVFCIHLSTFSQKTIHGFKPSSLLWLTLTAALWLATTMARVGRPLKAGDIILSGALGPMVQIESGDALEVSVSGLGSVSVAFA